jgi:hypothetical protein
MRHLPKPCLDCGRVTNGRSRCDSCFEKARAAFEQARAGRPRNRQHYGGDYARRAAIVRANATECWICGDGYRPDDPWQADHVITGNPDSILAAAHRSCNIKRSNAERAGAHTRAEKTP